VIDSFMCITKYLSLSCNSGGKLYSPSCALVWTYDSQRACRCSDIDHSLYEFLCYLSVHIHDTFGFIAKVFQLSLEQFQQALVPSGAYKHLWAPGTVNITCQNDVKVKG